MELERYDGTKERKFINILQTKLPQKQNNMIMNRSSTKAPVKTVKGKRPNMKTMVSQLFYYFSSHYFVLLPTMTSLYHQYQPSSNPNLFLNPQIQTQFFF